MKRKFTRYPSNSIKAAASIKFVGLSENCTEIESQLYDYAMSFGSFHDADAYIDSGFSIADDYGVKINVKEDEDGYVYVGVFDNTDSQKTIVTLRKAKTIIRRVSEGYTPKYAVR